MNSIIIVDLPEQNGAITGCWYKGYPVHQGSTEDSLNYAAVWSNENGIVPDQERLRRQHASFVQLLRNTGLDVHVLPFPTELNQLNNLHHDAVFVRDAGLMIGDMWIKGRFSADRSPEADAHAQKIAKEFGKRVVEIPEDAFLEFGEVFYLRAANETFYFGGLSRSNKQGHDFVRDIVKPDHYVLVQSEGYHLDTVFSPVLSKDNELIAVLTVADMIEKESLQAIEVLGIEVIAIDAEDSSGIGEDLGNYAVNGLCLPGKLLSCSRFTTPGVEERLRDICVEHLVSPLADFRYAGGSYHCLTNEMYT